MDIPESKVIFFLEHVTIKEATIHQTGSRDTYQNSVFSVDSY